MFQLSQLIKSLKKNIPLGEESNPFKKKINFVNNVIFFFFFLSTKIILVWLKFILVGCDVVVWAGLWI